MKQNEFQMQMDRLANQFKGAYGDERVKLIWREVGDYSAAWWENAVDGWIGSCRQAPLLPEIREDAARERERQHAKKRQEESKDLKAFFTGAIGPEDAKMLIGEILKRSRGLMADDHWASFSKMLDGISGSSDKIESIQCKGCLGSGVFTAYRKMDGTMWAFRCKCVLGTKDVRRLPQWSEAARFEYSLLPVSKPTPAEPHSEVEA